MNDVKKLTSKEKNALRKFELRKNWTWFKLNDKAIPSRIDRSGAVHRHTIELDNLRFAREFTKAIRCGRMKLAKQLRRLLLSRGATVPARKS